jgi:nitrogen fixation NifU-like protein
MYSEQLLEHFRNPRNVGELPPPARVIEVSNAACGDILRLSARIERDRIAEVAYKVRGCAASVGAGSALTELLEGRTVAEALRLGPADVEAAVGGLPPASRHAAVLCIDAVKRLLK